MTDRELLQKAAKAAGYSIDEDCDRTDVRDNGGGPLRWNPLEDDGDALRLAATLNIWPVRQYRSQTIVVQEGSAYFDELVSEPIGDDVCAAVRRAIVRAAADKADAAGAA